MYLSYIFMFVCLPQTCAMQWWRGVSVLNEKTRSNIAASQNRVHLEKLIKVSGNNSKGKSIFLVLISKSEAEKIRLCRLIKKC